MLESRNTKLAVVEAKAWDKPLTEGVGQAKDYAGKLAIRFTYATNGQGIYGIDMETGIEGELIQYPTPDELWNLTFATRNAWRDRFAAVPFEDRGGYFQGRYYQDIAIERVLATIVDDRERILLTLATGTGKTFIGFQIAWKLFQSRWNLTDWKKESEPTADHVSCFWQTGTFWQIRHTTLSQPSLKMRWYALHRMRSRRRARCPRTAASSSPSSRPL